MENITKSIIYGNSYQNRYGRFLPVCSSISDRGSPFMIQPRFSTSLTIYTIRLISKSTTVLDTPLECRKPQQFSLLRKKMWRISTMKGVIVMRLQRVQDKNYSIYLRNSVDLEIFRYQECLYWYLDPTIQSPTAI